MDCFDMARYHRLDPGTIDIIAWIQDILKIFRKVFGHETNGFRWETKPKRRTQMVLFLGIFLITLIYGQVQSYLDW